MGTNMAGKRDRINNSRRRQSAFNESPSRILHQKNSPVKGQIVHAGVRLGDLAEAAGISQSYLSLCLSGQRKSPKRQRDIFIAFRALSGLDIYIDEFWGKLLVGPVAAGDAGGKRKSKIAS